MSCNDDSPGWRRKRHRPEGEETSLDTRNSENIEILIQDSNNLSSIESVDDTVYQFFASESRSNIYFEKPENVNNYNVLAIPDDQTNNETQYENIISEVKSLYHDETGILCNKLGPSNDSLILSNNRENDENITKTSYVSSISIRKNFIESQKYFIFEGFSYSSLEDNEQLVESTKHSLNSSYLQYHQYRRSVGLDKFTHVDNNGKRCILQEVEAEALQLPPIPGIYFDKRQIGYRVRYHNTYVGWVALSRHNSIKEAYEYAKQLWTKARTKGNEDQHNFISQRRISNRNQNRRNSCENDDPNILYDNKMPYLCEDNMLLKTSTNDELIGDSIEYSFSGKKSIYNKSKPKNKNLDRNLAIKYNTEAEDQLEMFYEGWQFRDKQLKAVNLSNYSALLALSKFYKFTQEYMIRWPSVDGHYTIKWASTQELGLSIFNGEPVYNFKKKKDSYFNEEMLIGTNYNNFINNLQNQNEDDLDYIW
ncbi:uncharacterized protein CMU_007160 [Cryptosporidium muris RN66]|uniref:Uncharacterized protein n=1 Tax=Cryptosporidium muris (strain RN66) TaxID=441375 RepID=B6ADD6_CRYMR|nr:uncharacterized protein CMU_007160 [Cryptosporidium muris RN66]EEA06227.1 hypothetical protein, conserved [Cryptosporidium muris RN66]|eukprot:XP_002140576.1 hypothetical protein [Cryptosporidium muris RN66]